MYATKRARQMNGGWRHGIIGIDNVENSNSFVYKDKFEKLKLLKAKRQATSRSRVEYLQNKQGTNS